jgi:hypothetical protein
MKLSHFVNLSVSALLLFCAVAYPFAGGSGTAEDPYQISTPADLGAVNNDLTANYVLINDIDLAGTTYSKAVIAYNTGSGFLFTGTPFTGSFTGLYDGEIYSIKNLTIDSPDCYVGLFGAIGTSQRASGNVSSLNIYDCNIRASGGLFIGSVAGANAGRIINCSASGIISSSISTSFVGGLTGLNLQNISYSSSSVSVAGTINTGGLTGDNYGTIANCYSNGAVTGTSLTAGISGSNLEYSIYEPDGIFYFEDGDGFYYWDEADIPATLSGTITNCYCSGAISRPDDPYWGGVVEDNYDLHAIAGTYWNKETTGILYGDGGFGRTSEEMGIELYYPDWNFEKVWIMYDYPELRKLTKFYTVTFSAGEHYCDETIPVLSEQEVADSDTAKAPAVEPAEGYYFTGWDLDYTSVTSDMTVTAQYSLNGYRVTFDAGDYGIMEGETELIVNHGDLAVAPAVTLDPTLGAGWSFDGWDSDADLIPDENYTYVTSSMTVKALYSYSYATGSGTHAAPYIITNASDLEGINADLTAHYELASDIDLSAKTYDRAPVASDPDSNRTFDGTEFTGSLDGKGFKIIGLEIIAPDKSYVALIGKIGVGGTVSNLTLGNAEIFAAYYYIGGIAGINAGSIANCSTDTDTYVINGTDLDKDGNTVGSPHFCGGIAGCNEGTVSGCSNFSVVSGVYYVGGIAGENVNAVISKCYSSSYVTGSFEVGGIAGRNVSSAIEQCFTDSFVEGEGEGNHRIGGLLGYNHLGTATNCYATGDVCALNTVGGFVGENYNGNVTNCYSAGQPVPSVPADATAVWCFAGVNSGSITNCYWDEDAAQIQFCFTGGTGLSAAEMQDKNSFNGWDFAYDTAGGSWYMPETGYPVLTWTLGITPDINDDGGVDFADFAALATSWLSVYDAGADLDFSGAVDSADLSILASDWLAGL